MGAIVVTEEKSFSSKNSKINLKRNINSEASLFDGREIANAANPVEICSKVVASAVAPVYMMVNTGIKMPSMKFDGF